MNLHELIILLLIGLFAGFISGTFGVGGGIIIIPALVFILGLSQHQAQGTSLAMMLAPIGIFAVFNYYRAGYINIRFAIVLMIAFIAGAYLGSLSAINISSLWLKRMFGLLILAVGLRMIFSRA
ncbi:MAG: permease [Bacteroides sp. SM23_62_1]|nr:MAG: permease [Bacteroides sp. SM23_62_1]